MFLTNSGAKVLITNSGGVPIQGGDKTLLTSSDLTYRGLWRISDNGSGTPPPNYLGGSEGPLAFRRVGGELRLLLIASISDKKYVGTAIEGSWDAGPPPIMEYTLPTTFGTSPSNAPDCTYVRKWGDGAAWLPGWYYTGNGSKVGGLWYDADLDVLWVTTYDTYAGVNDKPWLSAVRLNDDGTVTKYGPWMFPLASQRYRLCAWWIAQAPASLTAVNANAEMTMGACVGSTAAEGNWGPGLYWFKKPTLVEYAQGVTYTLGTNQVNTALLRLTNDSDHWGPLNAYSDLFAEGETRYNAKRPITYNLMNPASEGQGVWNPIGDRGYWLASNDNAAGHVWIETASKWGQLVIGRAVAADRYVAYTHDNPYTYPDTGQEYYSNVIGTGNGYKPFVRYPDQYVSTGNSPSLEGAAIIYNPQQAFEVMAGTRLDYNIDYSEWWDWTTTWTTIPLSGTTVGTYPSAGNYEIYYCPQGNSNYVVFDSTTQRILFMQAWGGYNYGLGGVPTIAVIDVG